MFSSRGAFLFAANPAAPSGWNLAGAVYDNKSIAISSEDVRFKSDGTKMYSLSARVISQYSLSTAWDITTATSDSKSFSVATQTGTGMAGVFFSSDGTKMYAISRTNDAIYQYTLGTAWDISTASYASKSLSISARDTNGFDLFIDSTGTRMYFVGQTNDRVYQYTLSTAWDITTATYINFISISAKETNGTGLFFKDDGTKFFIVGLTNDRINQYSLSSAWDITTATADATEFSVASQSVDTECLVFGNSGTKMYISNGADIFQYSTV